MEARALVKMARISPRKAQLVTDLIRYKKIDEAFTILDNTSKKAAPIIKKLLNSAVANATNNHGMTLENLYVKRIFANEGPTIKRFHPRARGKAMPILKRTSHLEIIVSNEQLKNWGKK